MGLIDLFCDAVEIGANVGKVVLAPVEVAAKGVKAVSGVAADLAKETKDALTK